MSIRNTLIILALTILATACLAADTSEVELTSGKTLTGVLRPVIEGLYLLQTDETLYELSGGEIKSVDGREGAPRIDNGENFAHTNSYRRLLPSGDVEISQSMTIRNRGKKIQTTVRWGAGPHELYMYETMTALDAYGNTLDYRLEPRHGTDTHNIIVSLDVPVMPGEDMDLMVKLIERNAASVKDGVWSYTHWGDYSEDRLQNLKVELPAGSEVLSVNPPVRVVEFDGKSLVFWRRYYPKHARFPLTVTYKLD